jgi:hypothetical protein
MYPERMICATCIEAMRLAKSDEPVQVACGSCRMAISLLAEQLDEGAECQEASPLSYSFKIECGRPAVALIDNGDQMPYFMCAGCADHNVRNRGGMILAKKREVAA